MDKKDNKNKWLEFLDIKMQKENISFTLFGVSIWIIVAFAITMIIKIYDSLLIVMSNDFSPYSFNQLKYGLLLTIIILMLIVISLDIIYPYSKIIPAYKYDLISITPFIMFFSLLIIIFIFKDSSDTKFELITTIVICIFSITSFTPYDKKAKYQLTSTNILIVSISAFLLILFIGIFLFVKYIETPKNIYEICPETSTVYFCLIGLILSVFLALYYLLKIKRIEKLSKVKEDLFMDKTTLKNVKDFYKREYEGITREEHYKASRPNLFKSKKEK
ncbi:MAG: hypothetical protein AB1Z23_09080 [Eubacteriales bacterium]